LPKTHPLTVRLCVEAKEMKRATWVLFAFWLLTSSAAAQETAAVPWANKFFAPKDPPPVVVHDFGTVPFGTVLTHRFPMSNIYALPMQILSDPQLSCSACTKILRYTQKLEPRETGFIDVEMDARQFKGAKAVTISATFAGQRDGKRFQSTALLQIRAFSRTDVSVTPGQIAFGTVAQGQQSAAQTVDIQYIGQQISWQITGTDDTNAQNVKTSLQRIGQGRGSITYRLTAALKPDATSGALQDQIVLKTNDPTSPLLTIPVSGMVHAPLSVVPGNDVRLDTVPVGQETQRIIQIRAAKPFKIVKVEGEGDGLTVRYLSINGPVQPITITFRPTQPGELKRKLTIHTDQKDKAIVTIEGTAEK
jgi:Protein of unknown function (DUF1573)